MVLQSLPACGFRTNKRETTKSMTKDDVVSLYSPRSRDEILIRTMSIETLGNVNEQLLSSARSLFIVTCYNVFCAVEHIN